MATSNKIVDTRRLAAKGRFGDTEMRNVRGEPSHVTALEAYHMDTAGIQPSASKKSINPMTGLPEYHDYGRRHRHNQDGSPYIQPSSDIGGVDYQAGTGNVDDWLTDEKRWTTPGEFDIQEQSKDILTGGMENLQTQYGQYMGPGGFLERGQDIREKGYKSTYDTAMTGYDIAGKKLSEGTRGSYKELGDVSNLQRSKSNLAFSGTIAQKVKEGERDITKKYGLGMEDIELGKVGAKSTYDIGMEGSALTAEKGEADFMGELRKQMNVMLTDYLSATGEAYGDTGAGSIFEELNTLFDTYSENV